MLAPADIEVLYEDADLLALNKPTGLLAVPDPWDNSKENLMSLLEMVRPGQYLANVRRLDFNTSGVFVVAKNREAFRNLARQFSRT